MFSPVYLKGEKNIRLGSIKKIKKIQLWNLCAHSKRIKNHKQNKYKINDVDLERHGLNELEFKGGTEKKKKNQVRRRTTHNKGNLVTFLRSL